MKEKNNGSSKEKDFEGEKGFAQSPEHEDVGARAFNMPSLSQPQTAAQGLSRLRLV
jgi:hypothetical protein